MRAIDHAVEYRFGDDGIWKQRVPVRRRSVRRRDETLAGSFGDELIEVVRLRRGEGSHGEVVDDEDGRPGPATKTRLPRPIGVTTGEIGQKTRRLGERHVVAAATG